MAESNVYPSEEDFSYFCFDCRNTTQETEKDFIYVGAIGPYYTCTHCSNEFDFGFKREKIDSSESTISYICTSCKKPQQGTNCNFIFVGSLQFCFTCKQCGEKIDYGFKTEKRNSNDTPSHRCDVCGNSFKYASKLLHHSYVHSDNWPYRCLICRKGFITSYKLEIHKKGLDIIRKIQCCKCLKYFRGKICAYLIYSSTISLFCEKCSNGPSLVEYVNS
ncbi:hypothetical protein TNIN_68371 [Trichonephila inaurata madagascariensis]|uniref:C2H2-type domain-containing protein n=1 Tax=Trichonephila inaurata madagascariensis TaxID=2747483 RepID=A0A8X6X8Z2_9ARAC|nr:hypothetical protein TNIN_68371 [Trichonephila inaurata madagascariensis]